MKYHYGKYEISAIVQHHLDVQHITSRKGHVRQYGS